MNFPILLDDERKPYAILENAFDVFIKDQLMNDSNGQETLEFKLPFNDPKREILNNEDKILCLGREYVIRLIDDDKTDTFISSFMCEATWYDIFDGDPLVNIELKTVDARSCMEFILKGSGWTVGIVEPIERRTLKSEEPISRLQALRSIPKLYDGELQFDTSNRVVDLLNGVGVDREILISYEKNMDSIKRVIDSRELLTRIYVYGANNLSIREVNNGIEYVEDYSYFDKIGKPRAIKATVKNDDRFTNPNSLMDYGRSLLDEFSWPKFSYEVKVNLIGIMVNLGDNIVVYDKDLGIKGYMRIVKRTINVLALEQSEVQLDNVIKNFSDQIGDNTLQETSSVDLAIENMLSDVSVFNLLLNSRGDYGFTYWINHGFNINNTDGVSGKGAFICTGDLTLEQYIEQEVDVANRDSYVVSAQIEINDLQKGSNAEIGFEVILEYEDGTYDVQFIPIA